MNKIASTRSCISLPLLKTPSLEEFKRKREDEFKHQYETHNNTLGLEYNKGTHKTMGQKAAGATYHRKCFSPCVSAKIALD
jgi:hypothetical protein